MAVRHPGDEEAESHRRGVGGEKTEPRVALEHRLVGREEDLDLEVMVHEAQGVRPDGLSSLSDPCERGRDGRSSLRRVEADDVDPKSHVASLSIHCGRAESCRASQGDRAGTKSGRGHAVPPGVDGTGSHAAIPTVSAPS